MSDNVNHPKHYNSHPAGIECIDIVEHLPYNVGNAIKYCWRSGLKNPDPTEDLQKAIWYLKREVARRQKLRENPYGTYTETDYLKALSQSSLMTESDTASMPLKDCENEDQGTISNLEPSITVSLKSRLQELGMIRLP
jgi:hypothetical protein